MNKQIAKVIADQIVTAITDDMLDRSGLQNALEECDDEVRDEISATWMSKIQEILHTNIYRNNATCNDEAYLMLLAGNKIQTALADAGYAPR